MTAVAANAGGNLPAMRPFSVVVLAAGASAHAGRPKLLLPYLGRTLVEHAVRTALASGASEVVVVLGDRAEAVRTKLRGLPVRIVVNRDWSEGIGSSVRCGVCAVGPDIDSVVIALADQPRITPDHLRTLSRRLAETGKTMIASSYDGVLGAPCAFARSEFPRLLALTGEAGARSLIRGASAHVEAISFVGANVGVPALPDGRPVIALWDPIVLTEPIRDPHLARGPPATPHYLG